MMWDAAVWALRGREMQVTPEAKPSIKCNQGEFCHLLNQSKIHLWKPAMG